MALDLADAIAQFLDADRDVRAVLTGGVYSDEGPEDDPLPYAVLTEIGEGASYETADETGRMPYVDDGEIQLDVWAAGKTAVKQLGLLLACKLNDLTLTFDTGNLFYLRRKSRHTEKDPDKGPGGVDVWQHTLTFDYQVERVL